MTSSPLPDATIMAETLSQTLARMTARLAAAGIEGARRDARLLLTQALAAEPSLAITQPERTLNEAELARVEALIARREKHEPVSRILGRREFWSLTFGITPHTLDPRPDSETLVRALLDRIEDKNAPLHILDLGTGSGCLLLALLSELPAAHGLGVDISEAALRTARENAQSLGLGGRVQFLRGAWAEGLAGSWQVIVSNPPYIKDQEFEELAPEVAQFDPRLALAAGPDGLDAYRMLAPQAARLLAPGGLLALEIGIGQQESVGALLLEAGLTLLDRVRDLGDIERCLLATCEKPRNLAK